MDPAGDLAHVVEHIEERAGPAPVLVGISGPVAVGKTTVALQLAAALEEDGPVSVVSTDAFLWPNDELARREVLMRKGFPETYDHGAAMDALGSLRAGRSAQVPVYSHTSYDIVAGERHRVDPGCFVIVEGIVALQPPMVEAMDVRLYVHAVEEDVRGWFVERFLRLVAEARDPSSFYHGFRALPEEDVRGLAEATWDSINAPNLHHHIAPSAAAAHVVVEKAGDHSIAAVRWKGTGATEQSRSR